MKDCEKPLIIFLFSGNARTSPFSYEVNDRNYKILKSYTEYVFTDEFKKKYNFRIYVTTDNIHLQDIKDYFKEINIGNIHLIGKNYEIDYYMKHIDNKLDNINSYMDVYNSKDWSYYDKYENSIHQHYKIMDCYNLFENENDIKQCTFIVRLRMDIEFTENILRILTLLEEDPYIQIFMHWDFFAIGKPEIMRCYCNGLKGNYGNYNFKTVVPEFLPVMIDYNHLERKRWTYAPERQLFEMLFEYCNNNKPVSYTHSPSPR
ncbi:hypothetical protein EB118_20640, partial [bacterium]|nr:hypothetical protein [bacterium]